MGFTEKTFLFIFLPLSIIFYIASDKIFRSTKANNVTLSILSLGFLLWAEKRSFFVFAIVVLLTFISGKLLYKDKQRKLIALPVVLLVGILIFFKYAEYVVLHLGFSKLQNMSLLEDIIVPIGLSFIIFEALSYVIDCYRGDTEPGSLLDCITFLSLFPKLTAGPIILWKDFKPQLTDRKMCSDDTAAGIDRIIVGYAKKAIVADTFGFQIALINEGIASGGVDQATMWLRAILYFFQLYFDFAGYSDIAIGLCKIFGFEIKDNFNYPYLSKSVSEFWRRWHISLGTWFREYVYIPLGGSRSGNVYLNLTIVFILTGIWHGAGLPFLLWGVSNAFFVVVERYVQQKSWYKEIPDIVKWFITVTVICLMWVMFVSADTLQILQTYAAMFGLGDTEELTFTWQYYLSNRTILLLVVIVCGHLFEIKTINKKIKTILNTRSGRIIKRTGLLMLFVVDILFVVNSTYSPFIYFRF